MPGFRALETRSFAVVQLLTVSAAVAGAVYAVADLGRFATRPLAVAAHLLLAAGALAAAAVGARSYRAMRRELAARMRTEAAARAAAMTDELTGACNRRGFRMLAEHQLRVARRNGNDLILVCVDVNAFKSINDRFGHAQGDATLRDVAALLRRTVRDADVVARTGGDEFALLVVDTTGDAERALMGRLTAALAAYNARPEQRHTLALAVGMARLGAHPGAELDDLLRLADAALYRDKAVARARATLPVPGGDRRRPSAA